MTLDEKIGQLIMPAHLDLDQSIDLATNLHVGGFWFAKSEAAKIARELNKLQETSKYPLLISADFEKGVGTHVDGATDLPANMALAASRNPKLAYDAAKLTAQEARALGVHINFAPVLDVNNNPKNPIINIRSFGENPKLVAEMGIEAVRGYQENGLLATIKHFPGHGNTSVDSHSKLGMIESSPAEFENVELYPFRQTLAKAYPAAIMTAHLWLRSLDQDTIPATLSKNVISDLLRKTLAFTGLVFTDAMVMGSLTSRYSLAQASVQVIQAGCDIVLWPGNPRTTFESLKDAVVKGQLSEDRIIESARRVLTAKTKVGLHINRRVDPEKILSLVGTSENDQEAKRISAQCLTLVKDELKLIPLTDGKKTLVLTINSGLRNAMMTRPLITFHEDMARFDPRVSRLTLSELLTKAEVAQAIERAAQADVVVIATYVRVIIGSGKVELPEPQKAFIEQVLQKNKKTILVSFGSPYVASSFPSLSTYLCAYDNAKALQEAATAAIYGKIKFRGKLPVTISEEMNYGEGLMTR
jgi:beta-N-acetylhexosaminidase